MTIRKKPASRPKGRADWKRLRALTEDEIVAMAREDEGEDWDRPGRYVRCFGLPSPAVANLRAKLGLSQTEFARTYGLNLRTIQEWEQGRAQPDQPARILLNLIETEPATVAKVLDDLMRRRTRPKAVSALVHPPRTTRRKA